MRFVIFLLTLLWVMPCHAQLKEYEHAFDIDLKEDIPLVWRLQKQYKKDTANYDWKYDFSWRIPSVFNYEFKQDIRNFGAFEKRIGNQTEDELLRDILRLPKAFYPYIGPMLHTIRGLSGKVLDLPGIKETKNKFPDKIASRLQNIPNIEFASPHMYLLLSPIFWGEDMAGLEFPQVMREKEPKTPRLRINPEFMKKMKEKVKISDYTGGKTPDVPLGLRHFTADENTPLSVADVKAFVNTLDGIKKFSLSGDNGLRLIMIDPLITYWDNQNGSQRSISALRSMVNPCQSLVRRVKWSGLRYKFQQAIGIEGFELDDWAYTCDKVVKAHRTANLPTAQLAQIKILKSGYYYKVLDNMPGYTPEERKTQRDFLEAVVHMYTTTETNLEAVRPFNNELRSKFIHTRFENMGIPLILP